jgi:hypothetical protein
MRQLIFLASLASLLGVASSALAEGPEGSPPPGQPGAPPPGQPIMTPEGQYVEQQPPPDGQYVEQQPVEEQSGAEGRGVEYGLHLVVPIFFKEGVRPGIGLQLRGGWEFGGGFTAELNIGALINSYGPVLQDELEARGDPEIGGRNDGHSNIWIGAGVRYMFFNPSAFVPMVGAGVKLNIWNLCDNDAGDGLICQGSSDVTFGVNGMVGAAYEISPFVAIEAGLQVELSGAMRTFDRRVAMFLLPFVGGTLYY